MDRLVQIARFVALASAFAGVMAFAGGLVGAVGGTILVLLTHTVMGLEAGMVELVPASMGVGVLASIGLSIVLVAPHAPRPVFQPAMAATIEGNQL